MKLLLDQGLPRSTVLHLSNAAIEAVHDGEAGFATASDAKILDFANQNGSIVVILDADFHALLALSGATGPSAIRIRIEGLRGEELAGLLVTVLKVCKDDLNKGAMVSVIESRFRIRRLPLLREVLFLSNQQVSRKKPKIPRPRYQRSEPGGTLRVVVIGERGKIARSNN
jgi:predicted nuclease of predicted toxin-antitoxin system